MWRSDKFLLKETWENNNFVRNIAISAGMGDSNLNYLT